MYVFRRNKVEVARRTVRMPDAILGILGGMTRKEAEEILEGEGEGDRRGGAGEGEVGK